MHVTICIVMVVCNWWIFKKTDVPSGMGFYTVVLLPCFLTLASILIISGISIPLSLLRLLG